jgi:hypothetical protein
MEPSAKKMKVEGKLLMQSNSYYMPITRTKLICIIMLHTYTYIYIYTHSGGEVMCGEM